MLTRQEEHWDQDQRGWKEVRVDAKVYTYVVGMKYPMPGICGARKARACAWDSRWDACSATRSTGTG